MAQVLATQALNLLYGPDSALSVAELCLCSSDTQKLVCPDQTFRLVSDVKAALGEARHLPVQRRCLEALKSSSLSQSHDQLLDNTVWKQSH